LYRENKNHSSGAQQKAGNYLITDGVLKLRYQDKK
jgi:hypothetical protein